MRWNELAELIKQPYSVLVEIHKSKTKYFLIQNNTYLNLSVTQYNSIIHTGTLDMHPEITFNNSITEYLYKSK